MRPSSAAGRFIAVGVGALTILGTLVGPVAAPSAKADTGSPSGPSDVTHTADESTALSVAVTFGHKVTVDSKSSPTMLLQALPDGTMQAESDVVPARANVNGVWTAIDTTLQQRSDGWLEPKVAAAGIRFGPGGSNQIAQVQSASGQWFSETWPYGNLPTPSINGSHAVYPEVFPGVDLRLTATDAGMSEVLVIKSAQAAANPQLAGVTLAVQGATVQQNSSTRTLQAATAATSAPVASATPLWWDSKSALSNADTPGGDEPQAVPTTSTSSSVSLNVQAVATSAAPTYPLYIDPDWSSYLQADWYTDRAYPNQSYFDPPSDSVGYGIENGVGYLSHAFFQFQTDFLAGKHVLDAHFYIHQTYANSCDTTLVQLWEYGGSTSPGFTWNQEPNQWWRADDQEGNANGGPCAPNPAWVGFSAIYAATAAAANHYANIQLGMRVANESDSLTRKHYDWNAQLVVTYNTPPANPASPTFTTPPRSCSSDSTKPVYLNNGASQPVTLQVTQTDADGGTIQDAFYVYAATGSTPVKTYPSSPEAQGNVRVTIAAKDLAPGNYKWNARAGDYTDLSPGYSPWCYFTVKNSGPSLPGLSIATSAPYTVGQPITVNLTSNPAEKVAGFAVWWSYGSTPNLPVLTGSSFPACTGSGAYSQTAQYVCADPTTGSATITVSPPDASATLAVTSYDLAGNPAGVTDGSVKPATLPYQQLIVHANPDLTKVSDTGGHRWATDLVSGTPTTVTDVNTNPEVDLSVGGNATWDSTTSPDGPSLSFPGYVVLDRYVNGSKHLAALEDASASWTWEWSLGQIIRSTAASTAPSGTQALYSCALTSGDMTSLQSNCEGTGVTGVLLGYVWTTAPAGQASQLVYRCSQPANGDHFDSFQANCEGQHTDLALGYFVVPSPATTSTAAVDPTKSFTVSAILTPNDLDTKAGTFTALSHGAGVNSDFTLGVVNGMWEFCARVPGSASSVASDCAIDTAHPVTSGTATFVTGTYDAVDQLIRISTGGTASPDASVTHFVAAGTAASAGGLIVGAGRWNHASAGEWSGLITDPSVYQGVADSAQLQNLALQFGPN